MPSPNHVGALLPPNIRIRRMVSFSDAQDHARFLLDGPQRFTCLAGGTRSGKTFLIVRAILARALDAPESRHAMLRLHANAARLSLAQDTLPTVLKLCFPGVKPKERKQDGVFIFENGSRLTIGGLDDDERVEKILGLEYASIFLNEASQIPYASALVAFTRLAQMVPDLTQRAYVDLNPTSTTHWTNVLFGEKRDPLSRQPLQDPEDYARAFLNPRDNAANLSSAYLRSLEKLPERQRKRFFDGLYVDDSEDALFSYETIERNRRDIDGCPEASRKSVVIGVDPSGAHGPSDKGADEIGIIVAALGEDGEAYIIADRSCRENASVWGRRVVTAAHEFAANHVVVEQNFGGDMAGATIRTADPTISVKLVTASRGKAVRAEPISMRYAMNQVHHCGRFAKLEEQLCAFTGGGYNGEGSPDHADAAIWALTHLFAEEPAIPIITFYQGLATLEGVDDTQSH